MYFVVSLMPSVYVRKLLMLPQFLVLFMETFHVTTVCMALWLGHRWFLQALWKSPILGTEIIPFMVFRTTALTHVTIACYIFCVECMVFMMMHYSLLSLVANINAHS